jgi:hypothetical protein
MQKEDISKIVRDVLKEKNLLDNPERKSKKQRQQRPIAGPVVLNVFHAGVRKLAQALDQIDQIEKLARRSSVYTVESARSWVCGADVKEKTGTRCILDTVKPDGLEKTLLKADILVLPTFCFQTAAKVARLIGDDQESAIVLSALVQGKPTLATKDGFGLCEVLINDAIREEIDGVLAKLENYGMVFCETGRLYDTFQQMTDPLSTADRGGKAKKAEIHPSAALKLVTVKDIQSAVNDRQNTIEVAPGGIVTPLAADQAREYGIRIKRSG